jgi:nucleolar protein 56
MKATVVECSFGIVAFNEENKLIETILFPKKPQAAAEALAKLEGGKMVDEAAELIAALRKSGYDTFVFENLGLAKAAKASLGIEADVVKRSEAGEMLRANMQKFAVEAGFAKTPEEFTLWTHNVTVEMAKLRVRGAVEKRDLVIAQAIQTLDDLDRAINLFMGRVREWYGIHFPELDRLLDKHETYARLVVTLGIRNNFSTEKLEEEQIPESKAEQIARAAEKSMGADLVEPDLKEIQDLCKSILNLYDLRQGMENYLDQAMDEVAPNIKTIAGSLLGARLIAVAGGLTNLARRPASTIQVLGAEKALFRSLKTGTRPPKHGIIFQHPYLHDAKKWHRGKIARALAGKLAIAARVDAFKGQSRGEELKADLERRIEEIREKYVEPPQIPERKPKHREKRRGKWKRAGTR